MKKILLSIFVLGSFLACKQSPKEIKEEAKADSVVKTTIKTDKEKADSVFEYYQKKMDSTSEITPDMPAQ